MSITLESDVCSWRHLVKATKVTTGLTESNGSIPPGRWFGHLSAACRLGWDQLRG